ncbi:hypothetical protein M378DRAFT_630487 [Amanita muscaria Koide BX008]|uniref:Uncharacterized protein n=1 Tax=Amanita muscaria (strain Koide BX008) TaxID=946122 RepID=A0A0C2SM11_AMAMK|nr:hypothetical protein M378DRAFT_630487 [Amanita muscaria Koide BX008]
MYGSSPIYVQLAFVQDSLMNHRSCSVLLALTTGKLFKQEGGNHQATSRPCRLP